MPVPNHPLDFEFSSAALSERIVHGVLADDPVRVERAITAALEIHGGAGRAEASVFAPARWIADRIGPECRAAVGRAIDAYVNLDRAA